ncbi:hypothetical protein VNI00_002227 [Paramarasmius palmivorus]|uniref:F-box domain-containing protein n=1 Tax=Paramarasmius palmivorus TaxID=297713 RepID=A0AAW0E598_9AGAR
MSSLLPTPAVDYCQKSVTSGLRGRRFSLNPTLPQISFGRSGIDANDSTSQNESAIDEDDPPPLNDNNTSPALPSPLSNVYMSGYSTNVYIPRHQGSSLPTPGPSLPATPATECPPSTPVDRSGSIIELMRGEPAVAPSPKLDPIMKRRLACAFFLFFLCGWGDGVTGTALPYLKAQFNLSDMLTSALFCGSTVGFFIGTFIVEPVMRRLGLYHIGKRSMLPAWLSLYRPADGPQTSVGFSASQARFNTLISASIVHSSFFILMGVRLGFSAMFIAYATAALARAFLTERDRLTFVVLRQKRVSGEWTETGYGICLRPLGLTRVPAFGGAFAPLVCQSIIAAGAPWPNFYYGSLVVSAINLGLVFYAFRPTQRERVAERKETLAATTPRSAPGTPTTEDREIALVPMTPEKETPSSSTTMVASQPQKSTLLLALHLPLQWAFAVFGWLYCGSETTTQGFAVSYLLAARNANPKTVGYVTSGFNGGSAVGRVLWGHFSPRALTGEKTHLRTAETCVFGHFELPFNLRYRGVALIMHILIWLVNSNIENSFSTAIIGLMYGPVWPASLTMLSEILPPDVRMMGMAIFGAAGNLGTSPNALEGGVVVANEEAKSAAAGEFHGGVDSLEELDRKLERLEYELAQAKVERNSRLPVARLPAEVLTEIFSYLAPNPSTMSLPPYGGRTQWLAFTQICHFWRIIALNHAPLWTCPDLTIPALAEIVIQRSKTADLHLVLSNSSRAKIEQNLLDTIQSQLMNRVGTLQLTITSAKDKLRNFVNSLTQPAPRLRVLSLDATYEEMLTLPAQFLARDTPSLDEVSLNHCHIPWDSPLLGNLTSLDLFGNGQVYPSGQQFLDALRRMPLLETLKLYHVGPHTIEGTDVVPLPRLRCLRLVADGPSFITMFTHITYPPSAAVMLKSSSSATSFASLWPRLAETYNHNAMKTLSLHVYIDQYSCYLSMKAWDGALASFARETWERMEHPLLLLNITLHSANIDATQAEMNKAMEALCSASIEVIHISGAFNRSIEDDVGLVHEDPLFSPERADRDLFSVFFGALFHSTGLKQLSIQGNSWAYQVAFALASKAPNSSSKAPISFPSLTSLSLRLDSYRDPMVEAELVLNRLIQSLKWRASCGRKLITLSVICCDGITIMDQVTALEEVVEEVIVSNR